ncbi:MAG TPA: glycosyltransferase family 2 protein [Kofleriaceae bacterium]|nr:glycosyltransferase family 2 protein [Kofleriaceae bacterium]
MADPSVTVIVPVRNEVAFIEDTLRALLDQTDPPAEYEVIVVDGMSDDGTRDLIARLAAADPRLRMVDNPERTVPHALNVGIRDAKGEILIRVDGHTTVAHDFIRANLALLDEHPEAWSVGGPIAHRGRSIVGRAIAAAMSSSVGVGGARHRDETYEGYAEGTAFPAFRRWVFDRIGMFDEHLVRNQDDELNFRITRAGGQIFISPRVKHDYFVRDSYKALFSQYMQYAYWKVEVMRKHGAVIAPRHLVPGAFVVGLPLCVGASLLLPLPLSLVPLTPLVTYGGLLAYLAGKVALDQRDPRVGVAAAAAAATMHVAYGLGTLVGLVSRPGQQTRVERLMTRLTR